MFILGVKLTGVAASRDRLKNLAKILRDFRPLWRDLQSLPAQTLAGNIQSAAGFAPLSEAYARKKQGGAILVATGKLLASAQNPKASLGKRRAKFNLAPLYARPLHAGGKNLPERPFVFWPADAEQQVYAAFERHLDRVLAEARSL